MRDARAGTEPARSAREAAEPPFPAHGVGERIGERNAPAAETALVIGRLGMLSGAVDRYEEAIGTWRAREARMRDDREVEEARREAEAATKAALSISVLQVHRAEFARSQARLRALDAAWNEARKRADRDAEALRERATPKPMPIPAPAAPRPAWTPRHIAAARRPLAGLLAHYQLKRGQDPAWAERIADISRAVGSDAALLSDWLRRTQAQAARLGPASNQAEMIARVVAWSDGLKCVHTRRLDPDLIAQAYAAAMGPGQKPAPVNRGSETRPSGKSRNGKGGGVGYGD